MLSRKYIYNYTNYYSYFKDHSEGNEDIYKLLEESQHYSNIQDKKLTHGIYNRVELLNKNISFTSPNNAILNNHKNINESFIKDKF